MRILDQRSFRRGGVNPLTLVAVAAVASILFGVIFWGPGYWESVLMKEILENVGYEWQDTYSKEDAYNKLLSGMRDKHLSYNIEDDDCVFYANPDHLRVECQWDVLIEFPIVDHEEMQHFEVNLYVEKQGKPEIY